MPSTQSGINYDVREAGSGVNPSNYKEHWVDGSNQATIEVHVAVGDWQNFRKDFFGDAQWVAQNGGGYKLSRSLPMFHPRYSWMIGQELEVIGAPQTVNANDAYFDDNGIIIAAATFRGVMYNVTDDATAQSNANGEASRWCEIKRSFNTQNLTIANSFTHWKDYTAPSGIFKNEAVYPYSWTTFVIEWNNVPTVNGDLPSQLYANWDTCRGKSNSASFLGKGQGTMLCHDPKITPFLSALGARQFKIEIPVEYQGVGWDYKFRGHNAAGASSPNFYQVEAGQYPPGGGAAVYFPYIQQADLNKLFQAV